MRCRDLWLWIVQLPGQLTHLISVVCLIIVVDDTHHSCVVLKFNVIIVISDYCCTLVCSHGLAR